MIAASSHRARPATGSRSHADIAVSVAAGSDLLPLSEKLAALYDRALDGNLFLGPDFFLPLVSNARGNKQPDALLAWDGAPFKSNLIGFLPLARNRARTLPLAVFRGFRHPLVSSAVPLVDAAAAESVWLAMLDTLAANRIRAVLELENVVLNSAVFAALETAAAASNRPMVMYNHYQRALLEPAAGSDQYIGRIKSKRLQELRRTRRKLENHGLVEHTICYGDHIPAALEEFLDLEASGWKGKRGTALASDPTAVAFVRSALTGEAQRPAVRIEMLRLDGKAIAGNVFLLGHDYACSWKSGYDEAHRAHAPGKLLDFDAISTVRDERWTPRIDSLALPGHNVEDVWLERVPVATVMVGVTAGMPDADLRLFQRLEIMRLACRSVLKDAYHRATGARGA